MADQSLIDPDAPVSRREFEALKAELTDVKKGFHDMAYKGHDYWNLLRKNIIRLVTAGPVSYMNALDDPWLRKHSHADSAEQWRRIRTVLIKRHPHRNGCPYPRWDDGIEFVDYHVRGGGRPHVYLSLRENMPCDAEVALRRERVSKTRFAQQLRRLREKYPLDARKCRCGFPGFDHAPASYSKPGDSMGVLHGDGGRSERNVSGTNSPPAERGESAESLAGNLETNPFGITRRSDEDE